MKKINLMYFSPTGTSKKIGLEIGARLLKADNFEKGLEIDFTLPEARESGQSFREDDILIIALPVYAGRLPNVLLDYLATIKGQGSIGIPIVLYGNRDYDDALIELNDILIENGFKVIAGGSFIGEHSFSYSLAKGRPDREDLSLAREFADAIARKIEENNFSPLKIKGNRPYRSYYVPKDEEDEPVDIRRVVPKTDKNCIDCKICAQVCPMGSIDYKDVSWVKGICIKCGACIKKCPKDSKYFDDPDYLRHKRELEEEFKIRKRVELFI